MTPRSLEANRQDFRDLQQKASDVFESLPRMTEGGRRGPQGNELALGGAASWCRYIQYGVAAVRTLHDAGLGTFAAPILRSLIEHAVTIMSVAKEPEAFRSYQRAMHNSTKRVVEAMQGAGLATPEALEGYLAQEVDDSGKTHDSKVNMKHKCDDLDDSGARLYLAWLEETIFSHANDATAKLYLRPSGIDEWPTLTLDAQIEPNAWNADALAADAFIMALDGFSLILEGDPLRDEVRRLNARKDGLFAEAQELLST